MALTEKIGTVNHDCGTYSWTQTIDDVMVTIPVPAGTRGRQVAFTLTSDSISVGLQGQPPILTGPLFGPVKHKDSLWTLEDGDGGREISIVLTKQISHQTWSSVIKGQDELDVLTQKEMQKKMMLERFQKENPGFDFSGAEFSGEVPEDGGNFMRNI